jgi:predicted nucleotidyltransferase
MLAKTKLAAELKRHYLGARVPMRVIRKFARDVARRFKPDKIILFGSYAYGTPNADSDVDILVVMPCRNRINQAVSIRWHLPVPFAMDLIVRTPRQMDERLKMGDSFMTDVINRGKVLYDANSGAVDTKSGK